MKKLNKMVLKKAKVMTTPEMKHITGGYGEGSCCYRPSGLDCAVCGLSKEDAEWAGTHPGGANWCCDSCNSTSGWGNKLC